MTQEPSRRWAELLECVGTGGDSNADFQLNVFKHGPVSSHCEKQRSPVLRLRLNLIDRCHFSLVCFGGFVSLEM